MLQFCFDQRHVFSLFSLGNRVCVMVSLSVVVLIRCRLQCSDFSCNLCWALLHYCCDVLESYSNVQSSVSVVRTD